MSGNVDHVVHATQDPVVAILCEDRGVACEIRPIAPVFTLWIPAILGIVRFDKTFLITPDCLERARPRVLDTDIPSDARSLRYGLALFIEDDRMNAGHSWTCAAGFHRMNCWHRAAQESTGLRLPPCIDDHSLTLANHIVVPAPDLRLNWLAHGRHMFKLELVLSWLIWPRLPEHPNGGGRGVEYVDIELLGDPPGAAGIRVGGDAFVDHRGRRKG